MFKHLFSFSASLLFTSSLFANTNCVLVVHTNDPKVDSQSLVSNFKLEPLSKSEILKTPIGDFQLQHGYEGGVQRKTVFIEIHRNDRLVTAMHTIKNSYSQLRYTLINPNNNKEDGLVQAYCEYHN